MRLRFAVRKDRVAAVREDVVAHLIVAAVVLVEGCLVGAIAQIALN